MIWRVSEKSVSGCPRYMTALIDPHMKRQRQERVALRIAILVRSCGRGVTSLIRVDSN